MLKRRSSKRRIVQPIKALIVAAIVMLGELTTCMPVNAAEAEEDLIEMQIEERINNATMLLYQGEAKMFLYAGIAEIETPNAPEALGTLPEVIPEVIPMQTDELGFPVAGISAELALCTVDCEEIQQIEEVKEQETLIPLKEEEKVEEPKEVEIPEVTVTEEIFSPPIIEVETSTPQDLQDTIDGVTAEMGVLFNKGSVTYQEAVEACVYTAGVMRNRKRIKGFGSMRDVLKDPGQYASSTVNQLGKINYMDYDPSIAIICQAVLEGREAEVTMQLIGYPVTVPDNLYYQAQFKQGNGTYKQIDNQYYCYL